MNNVKRELIFIVIKNWRDKMGTNVTKMIMPRVCRAGDVMIDSDTELQQQQQHPFDDIEEVFDLVGVPNEILETVLSYLPGKTLIRYRRVCRLWRNLIDSQSLWKDKCEREGLLGEYIHYIPEPPDYRIIYFYRPYTRNLIKNPCAKEGLDKWTVIQNGGHKFKCETNHPGSDDLSLHASITESVPCWATSYGVCMKSQLIDLLSEGCSVLVLDECRPTIEVSEWYSARFDCEGRYELQVELISADQKVLDRFDFTDNIPVRKVWHQVRHLFKNYPKGLRYIKFTHSGVDSYFWAGHYGPKFTMATVRFVFP